MKEKFMKFMYGRYGVDQYSRFLLIIAVILLIVSTFMGNGLLYIVSLGLMVYLYFRVFSRNEIRCPKCYTEFIKKS